MTRQRLTGLSLRAALRLYLVVGPQDSDDVTTVVAQAVAGGVTMVQWRDKYAEASQQTVMAVQGLCRAAGVPFLVNDDVTLAKAIGADGVHLGQDDMDPHSARAILGDQALLGLSSVATARRSAMTHKWLIMLALAPCLRHPQRAMLARPLVGGRPWP